ncbi:MAG: hypothetical protein JW787_08310 [Sedimentisphaerales bacterium]|nr:hypothetical protein [Sedimentisphaerales bacterium]
MWIKIKRRLLCSVLIVLCGLIVSCGTLSQSEKEKKTSGSSPAGEEITKLYQELIELRQQEVVQVKRRFETGLGTLKELAEAEIKAAEARIQLAQLQDKNETVIEELQNLIQSVTEIRNSLQKDLQAGIISRDATIETNAKLIELKILLARFKLEQD